MNELFIIINEKLNLNPITTGSYINTITIIDNIAINTYVKIHLNINKIYTASDYKIVFYDLTSFVKCYVGIKSVKNVTWDTTLGWILGFHYNTEYNLNENISNILIVKDYKIIRDHETNLICGIKSNKL